MVKNGRRWLGSGCRGSSILEMSTPAQKCPIWDCQQGHYLPRCVVMRGTLEEIARHLGVNARTVRRYLERRLIPGAHRTPGGHWCVPGSPAKIALLLAQRSGRQVRAIKKAMRGAERSLRTCETVAEVAHVLAIARAKKIPVHQAVHHRLTNTEGYNKARDVFDLISENPKFWLLLDAIKRVRKAGRNRQRVTRAAIARQLGISRAWFYKTYEPDLVKRALREVAQHEVLDDSTGPEVLRWGNAPGEREIGYEPDIAEEIDEANNWVD